MKNLAAVIAFLLLAAVAVHAEFKFGGEACSYGWEAKTNGATIKEYFRANETT